MAIFPTVDYVSVQDLVRTQIFVELDFGDAAGTYKVPAPAGTWVHDVGGVVTTLFNNAGSLALNISDSDSATTYYLTNAQITLSTAATTTTPAVHNANVTGAANGYGNGKYYHTDGTINFVFNPGTATSGRFIGYVEMTDIGLSGLAA